MQATLTILRRELAAYFNSPLAYVFIVIFLVLAGSMTFYVGGWLERGQADLRVFFQWHPGSICFWYPRSACGCGPRSASPEPSSS